jgi:hypothetical protein
MVFLLSDSGVDVNVVSENGVDDVDDDEVEMRVEMRKNHVVDFHLLFFYLIPSRFLYFK